MYKPVGVSYTAVLTLCTIYCAKEKSKQLTLHQKVVLTIYWIYVTNSTTTHTNSHAESASNQSLSKTAKQLHWIMQELECRTELS